MKVTFKGDYALKAVLELALNYNKDLVTSNALAKTIDAPIKFLEQVLLELKKGGIVESKRGNIGGYMLAKAPSQITVGEVIRLIDGPIEPISCVNQQYANCADIQKCVFKKVWHEVSRSISQIVDKVNFKDLAAEVQATKEEIAYYI